MSSSSIFFTCLDSAEERDRVGAFRATEHRVADVVDLHEAEIVLVPDPVRHDLRDLVMGVGHRGDDPGDWRPIIAVAAQAD